MKHFITIFLTKKKFLIYKNRFFTTLQYLDAKYIF